MARTQYFPDRSVKKEINNLKVICSFQRAGCPWNMKFQDYEQREYNDHNKKCPFRSTLKNAVIPFVAQSSPPKEWIFEPELFMLPVQEDQYIGFLSAIIHTNPPISEKFMPGMIDGIANQQWLLSPKERLKCLDEVVASPKAQVMKLKTHTREFDDLSVHLRQNDKDLDQIKVTVTKLEKTIKAKSAESGDHDFRLSLIENSNHDGSMIWKIPQFSQRRADAQNGKYTSIFSLPFYSGRYGYKMCLRLYIMGDGIGKGTHLSLFFVVMRGEFDNILQWPFTHKVTFKLINQAGGRDIVDTFQPDPMSSSFRKPKSDMNIASGCPRFVSHTELERGGFIVDDTVFIKCMIDTSTIRHPYCHT